MIGDDKDIFGYEIQPNPQLQQIPPNDVDLDQPYDASDPKQVQQRKTKAGRDERTRQDVVRALMETKNGRMWIRELLERCHIFEDCLFESDNLTQRWLGERTIGLILLTQIHRHPELYVTMIKEAPKANARS